MNTLTERQEARRERLEEAAEKTQAAADAALNAARIAANAIPFGQPILAGHYSANRDRRFRGRITTNMRNGIKLVEKAKELKRRASAVGKGGISSDDVNAIAKLQAQVVALEAMQTKMKKSNQLVRKNDRDGLAKLGYSESEIAKLFTPDFMGRLGFPAWMVTNNGANIRRIKERIKILEKAATKPEIEPIIGDGWSIREDVSENRIIITFDEKPCREVLAKLKHSGFRWSPTRGGHVRMRSDSAIRAAKLALEIS